MERDWGLNLLHNTFKDALVDIDDFCKSNEISYSLAYGSVLGAVRHNGFIPWDDDVDIYMTYDDYLKFKKNYKKDLIFNKKYYLQEFDSIDEMVELPKIRLNGTTFIENCYKNLNMHHGIYIDIFILHNAGNSAFERVKQYLFNQYLVLKSLSNKNYNEKMFLLLKVLRLFPYNFLRKKSLKELYKHNDNDSEYFFDTDLRTYKKSFYKKELIFPIQYMQFEDIYLPVPHLFNDYLHMVYGDYLKIPNVEEIKSKQHATLWDVSCDYKKYLPLCKTFDDERSINK